MPNVAVYQELSYAFPHNHQQTFDLYCPAPCPRPVPLVIFVHGGAWRSGDKAELELQGRYWAGHTTFPMAVCVPNYRLSGTTDIQEGTEKRQTIYHPVHTQDVATVIRWLRTPGRSPIYGYDPNRIYLLGHSAGAQIVSLIALQPGQWISDNDWKAIRGVVGIQGIYDIPGLIRQRPDYIDFVEMAFGPAITESQRLWVQGSPQYINLTPGHRLPPFNIMHCPDDELVDDVQAQGMYQHLKNIVIQTEPGITSDQLDWRVTHETALSGRHFEMLQNEQFAKKIVEWIAATEGNRKRPPPAPFRQASEPASVTSQSVSVNTNQSAPAIMKMSPGISSSPGMSQSPPMQSMTPSQPPLQPGLAVVTTVPNTNPAPPSPAASLTSIQTSTINLEHPPLLPRTNTAPSTGVQVFTPPTPPAPAPYVATQTVTVSHPVTGEASPLLPTFPPPVIPQPVVPVGNQTFVPGGVITASQPNLTVDPPMVITEGIGFIPPPTHASPHTHPTVVITPGVGPQVVPTAQTFAVSQGIRPTDP